MALRHVWLIPVFECIIVCSALVIPYLIATAEGHVYPFLPYISDSGTLAPESCVFGLLLNIGAIFVALSVYLRHRQIVEYYGNILKREGRYWRPFSTFMLWIGLVCSFGIAIVANFQETRMFVAHMIGAIMAFSLIIFYMLIQAIYQYRMTPPMASRCLAHFRLALGIISAVAFFTTFGAGFTLGPAKFDHDYFHWSPNVKGYSAHLVSTISEWVMGFAMQIYILSYAYELRGAKLRAPKLILPSSSHDVIAVKSGRGESVDVMEV